MQIALKSRETFADDSISVLATETVRLSLAGVKSYSNTTTTSEACNNVNDDQVSMSAQMSGASSDMINAIAEVVVSKLKESSWDGPDGAKGGDAGVINNVSGGGGRRRGRGRGGRNNNNNNDPRKCRGCQKTGHVIKNCTEKFCEACGQRGHRHFDRICPNYS